MRQAEAIPAPCTCPQDRLEQCQALKAALAALETTSERTRRVFLAHRIDGIPQTVLARENGVSPTLVNFMIRGRHGPVPVGRGLGISRSGCVALMCPSWTPRGLPAQEPVSG